jgi:sigma-B regulation protein RsbU (phosphoserine phosphatase)
MSESTRNKEKIRQRDYKLNALLDITVAINSNLSIDELLRQYEKVLREQLSIDRLILFAKQDHWRCILKFGINRGVPEITDESFFQKLKEINFTTSQTKKSFDVSIPIKQNDETIAYLLAGDESEDEIKMSPVVKHMRFIQTLTNVLVVAIQNRKLQEESLEQERMNKELELAAEMQAILLPHALPKNKFYEVGAFYRAHQQVGGDYYDFMELNENESMFCMADVSGKGVSAAFLMANFQAYIRSIFSYHPGDLVDIVRELNTQVMRSARGEKYITLFLAVYKKTSRTLHYVNCGHNPPVLADANGYAEELKLGTIGLGMFDELPKIIEGEIKIRPESLIVCFTDGLVETENHDNEEFGTERLKQIALTYFNDNVNDLNDIIMHALNDFRGDAPYYDDLAILTTRFK